ncbi:MAG: carbon-nitrogen hydrolase family protein [Bacteroidetes bacterium]|nr:MAG: carbon-nitrogen hydrolase family protein [Bacteroidota bacterium]
MQQTLTVALAQIAPVWLNRTQTLAKMLEYVRQAAHKQAGLVVFGEALLPGYPFWLELSDGARFNSPVQKTLFAHYAEQAVQLEAGHLDPLCQAAGEHQIAVVTGIVERPADRGGHSLYCSLVYIDTSGTIVNVHRKLMPTYEERLVWSPGDGHGLQTFPLGPFTMGGLNCWENWMPLPRAALYARGEDLHLALWPGNQRNTELLTRTLAQEGRSYVLSVCGLFRRSDIPEGFPHRELIVSNAPGLMADGGSCVAAPDGTWLLEPQVGEEGLYLVELDYTRVLEERQNFDPSGHYARPDVLRLVLNPERQRVLT